ncbi:MAG: flagellar basal body-associated FliL family protein [Azoarcus sp.]|jgi:flagellar FliL protein|nr:flagellar basal body-associated FliL family protein [Azoarcus sp.]
MAQAAKPPAKQEAAPAPAPAPAKRGKLLLIVVLVAVLALLLSVLVVVALLLMKKSNSGHETAAQSPAVQEVVIPSAVDLSKPPVFAPLDPFTVNLQNEDQDDGHYLQAVIALRVTDPHTADALKGWMPEIRHRIIMLMSAKRPTDIQNTQGREALASEIQVQLNTMLGVPPPPQGTQALVTGPIQGVLFNSFIIQ